MKILKIIFPICFAGLQAGVYADEAFWLKLLRLTTYDQNFPNKCLQIMLSYSEPLGARARVDLCSFCRKVICIVVESTA